PSPREIIPVTLTDMAHRGFALGRHEGRVVLAAYGIPGEDVMVEVTERREDYLVGHVVEVRTAAPSRVQAPCVYFGQCGGCQWQHLPYEKQLHWKEEILKDTFERLGRIPNPPLLPILSSPKPWHYRNRIQLHVNREGEIGFYKTHGQKIISIEECKIADEAINETLKKMDHRKARQLGWEIELIVDEESGKVVIEAGKGAFTQVNKEQNKKMVEAVVGLLKDEKNILELFAGGGNFSFPLATAGAHVTAIEQMPSQPPPLSEVPKGSVQFVTMKVEKALKQIVASGKKYDAILLDPPRKGAKLVLKEIVALNPKKIVYVSCFPPTLVRDLQYFIQKGYHLEKVQPIDMFPQTYHIESISLLTK
ncbi:MAG: class I SAM-dependent RNA methyltransferase, partial [bacterium]|nr:class I SAM-dependent RNA methyltransferase [bacterium]